jgi:hypothetical protein
MEPDVSAQGEYGERGIRTLGPLLRTTVFETARFNRSRISPDDVPKRIRTSDLQIRNLKLYPAELWARKSLCRNFSCADGEGGIRTPGTLSGYNSLAGSPIRPLSHLSNYHSGAGGIRTPGAANGSTVFKTASFNHSDTAPGND